jgi:hypothetical protein
VNIPLLDAPAARDQLHDATHIAANVSDVRGGDAIFDVSADKSSLSEVNDLKIILAVVSIEVLLGPGAECSNSFCSAVEILIPTNIRLSFSIIRASP